MLCGDLIEIMNRLAPEKYAESWDNSGLIIGSSADEVSRVLISLDYTRATFEEALNSGCEMVITHHPPVFSKISKINNATPVGKLILDTAKAGISVYSAHTNLDYAKGGTSDTLAEILGLENIEGLMPSNEFGESLGRTGYLKTPISLKALCAEIKAKLNIESILFVGEGDKLIKKVALITGSGSEHEYFNCAIAKNADVYITGDLKYHYALDALALGLNIIDATHYATEVIVCKTIEKHLRDNLGKNSSVQVEMSKTSKQPFNYV